MNSVMQGLYNPENPLGLRLRELAKVCGDADHVAVLCVKDGRPVYFSMHRLSATGKTLSCSIADSGKDDFHLAIWPVLNQT